MARIRTIPKAIKEIKENDPNSSVTMNALRQWVREGRIRSTKAGRYILVDLDEIERAMIGGAA